MSKDAENTSAPSTASRDEIEKQIAMSYYELCISNDPNGEETDDDFWICIKGLRQPTIAEANAFARKDAEKHGGRVIGVYPIDEEMARGCYWFDNEAKWPVFGEEANDEIRENA